MAATFAGKVALVTGGGSGIGQASALAFAREGAQVVIGDVDDDGGGATVAMIRAAGGDATFIHCDVADIDAAERLVAGGLEAFGRLDCAVNNAGIQGDIAPAAECTKDNWDRTIAVNLSGIWHCMKFEIPHLLKSGSGSIVNVSSNFGLVGSYGMPAYSASKHGIIGLTKTAALEYAKSALRVNAVCPGPVQTPMVDKLLNAQPELADKIIEAIKEKEPVGRWGQAEEIAASVIWLCSDAASFVTGAVLPVDGGYVAQ